MKVTLILCDAAQVAGGKLYILGAGWTIMGPGPAPFALAALVEAPAGFLAGEHQWALALLDADGHPVQLATENGPGEVVVAGSFSFDENTIPPAGSTLSVPLAISFAPIPLGPGQYTWQLSVDGLTQESWSCEFTMAGDAPLLGFGISSVPA